MTNGRIKNNMFSFQGNYAVVTMKNKEGKGVKKFRTYKEQERDEDGFDKSKRTREKRKQRRDKRDVWQTEGWDGL